MLPCACNNMYYSACWLFLVQTTLKSGTLCGCTFSLCIYWEQIISCFSQITFFFLAAVKTEMSVSISGVIHMVSHGSMRHWRDELLKLPNTPFLNKSLSKQLWKILVKKRDTERESLTGREIFNSALLSQHYRSEY